MPARFDLNELCTAACVRARSLRDCRFTETYLEKVTQLSFPSASLSCDPADKSNAFALLAPHAAPSSSPPATVTKTPLVCATWLNITHYGRSENSRLPRQKDLLGRPPTVTSETGTGIERPWFVQLLHLMHVEDPCTGTIYYL